MAFNLNGFNFNQSIQSSDGHVINTWADILNRAGLGLEVMHERNAHNFPLDFYKASRKNGNRRRTALLLLLKHLLLVDTCINLILVRLTYTWAFFITYGLY